MLTLRTVMYTFRECYFFLLVITCFAIIQCTLGWFVSVVVLTRLGNCANGKIALNASLDTRVECMTLCVHIS